jgi:hypothetical protein
MVSFSLASTPKIVTYKTQKDFEKGKPKGVSINSIGEVSLAPRISEVLNPDLPFLWTGAADAAGNLYVAGGSKGQVFKIDSQSNTSVVFDTGAVQVYALAVDKQQNLYVATSPKGKVYKIPRDGKADLESAIYFDPNEVYIWSLLVDEQNNLFVATGEKGNIYKVDAKGTSALFYESEDAHIRKIIFDRQGNLLVGTSNKGVILRIDSRGQAFVLYDSPQVEITDLLLDANGTLYAAAAGEEQLPRTATEGQVAPAADTGGQPDASASEEDEIDISVQNIPGDVAPRAGKAGSELYQIDKDGTVRRLWSAGNQRIFAMSFDIAGNIVAGTGEPGRLYAVNSAGEHTLLTEFDEMQVTALGKDAQGEMFVCVSNPAKAYRLSREFNTKGEYLSEVIDAQVASQWGALSWEAALKENTAVVFYSRSGNTERPDKTWSAWSKNYTNALGEPIASPPARFLQLKAELTTSNRAHSPVLQEINFSYLQKNIAPQIKEITLHPPGDYFPDVSSQTAANSHLMDGVAGNQPGGQTPYSGRKSYQKGYRSVSWKSQDDNDDNLTFDLFYRGKNSNSWNTLVKDFRGQVYSWDSELMADGEYVIKIVAKDNLSNPPALTLNSEKISPLFKVDNSGPKVSNFIVQKQGDRVKVAFAVQDDFSLISSVEFGLNVETWKLVYPLDGISDSKIEQFEITFDSAVKGSNTLVIKAKDELGNIGFGKTNFEL